MQKIILSNNSVYLCGLCSWKIKRDKMANATQFPDLGSELTR